MHQELKLMMFFFQSLLKSRKSNSLTIFFTSNWMIGWDLQNRLLCYSYLLNINNVLIIDLDNSFQVAIANYFICEKNCDSQPLPCRSILERCLWDMRVRKSSKIKLSSKEEYRCEIEHFRKGLNVSKYSKVSRLITSENVKNILLVQEAYLELWVAKIASDYDKVCFFPETEFGPLSSVGLPLCVKKKIYINLAETHFDQYISYALESLHSRVCGEYEKSSLGQYSYKVSEKTGKLLNEFDLRFYKKIIVFFMHAFTDSPNYGVYHEDEMLHFDHYDFLLNLQEWASEKSEVLVLLRFHPHSKMYPSDLKYNESVFELVDSLPNIDVISYQIPISKIFEYIPSSKLVCLSGFGSVNLETAFLGVQSFNYKKNIYTELGISKYFIDFDDLIADSNCLKIEVLRNKAIKIEASREHFKSLGIFTINNANFSSVENVFTFLGQSK